MRTILAILSLLLALLASTPGSIFGQDSSPPPAVQLDAAEKQAILLEVGKVLQENYIYPQIAEKMQQGVEARMKSGAYNSLNSAEAFAEAVSEDLRGISKDKHLRFRYDPEAQAHGEREDSKSEEERKKEQEAQRVELARDNFGFRKVERLAGNIGYLDFRYFASPELAGETAVAALQMLSGCDAILIDLRRNGGGDPAMIQLMSSYFFEEPTHLNDIYSRRDDRTENYWTLPYVPGRKMTGVDLYVLTSNYTFSGAEEFSYNMKNLKRATLVGETTGGGAHPVDGKVVHASYVLVVPFARAINPITKTNWEGTGVSPDVAVPADQALEKAYLMALEKLKEKAASPEEKNVIEWTLQGEKAKLTPVTVSEATLRKYAGTYETRKITLDNGALYYQRTGPKYRLTPMTQTTFFVEGLDSFRVEFVLEGGKAKQLVGLYDDGRREPSPRTR
jgi:Periplasmic protease